MTKQLRIGVRLLTFTSFGAALFSGVPALAQQSVMSESTCRLESAGDKIKHVIQLIFDNVHFRRDNPNVPSDLEQMPHLLNFIQSKGVLNANHHAVLISHTADDEMSFLTGVYGDRHGIPVANSYGIFRPDGSTAFSSSFFYWTNRVNDVSPSSGDSSFGMLNEAGKNAPAPWAPFTRAGCDVGTFSNLNIVVENTSIDVPRFFGVGSNEANETGDQQFADFTGAAVHCAKDSPLCSKANHGVADMLPQEPGGYNGFNALFGAKYMSLAFHAPIRDLDGNVIVNSDSKLPGFPGFSPTASQSLGYIVAMQEAGVPVTLAYIADLHDSQTNDSALGPGDATYVAQIKSYDAAFEKFFARLKSIGIDENNTLFIITADEGDHFVGGAPSPVGCNGVHTACTYSQIGALNINLNALVAAQAANTTPFAIHFDMAPTVYIRGNPARNAAVTRQLERDFAKLTAVNPLTKQVDHLSVALADPVEMGLLHMVTSDPLRTPTFTMFGAADYFFQSFGSTTPTEDPTSAWNHGGIQPEIGQTWLGLVGPGVRRNGDDGGEGIEFSDHTDIRPTVLALVGLQDDYANDGRVLFEALDGSALPKPLGESFDTLLRLGRLYKQINAPFGQLGLTSLQVSTAALASNTPQDSTYTVLENKIAGWRAQRDALASQMRAVLDAAANGGKTNEGQAEELIEQAQALLNQVNACAADVVRCAL